MRICYLNHDLKPYTGAGRFCLFLLSEMEKIFPEAEMTVFTSEPSADVKHRVFNIRVLEQPAVGSGAWGFLRSIFKIRRDLKRCDLIHALDGWPYGVLAALASVGLNKKLIITAVGSGAVAPLHHFFKRPLLTWALRRASAVTAVSRHTKSEVLKVAPDLKITVINHGVDFPKYQVPNFKSQINLKIQNLKPYILSVGTLKKRKGYDYSIAAFARIAPKFPDLKYVIVGQGTELENLKSKIKNQKLEDRVVFLSDLAQEDLIELYHNAELFILLPQQDGQDMEGFGLVFLEAAACGLPVVSCRNSAAEDAVLDGQNGILVDSQDTEAAARAMAKILSDARLRADFSAASLEFARKMSWQKTAREYTVLY